jgi:hypothetical protein
MYAYTGQRLNSNGTIDMEITHPVYGVITFTASPDDPEEHGRLLFADAQATAAPYVEPDPQPVPVPESVSRFQARAALLQSDLLETAETAIQNGDAITKLVWADAQEFRRASPTVAAIAGVLSLTESEVDDLFRLAITIEA